MKIRNVSGDDRIVPALGGRLVPAGAVVEVPPDHPDWDVFSFTQQTDVWEAADEEAKKVHRKALKGDAEDAKSDEPKEG